MKFITALFLIGFLSISSEYAVSFNLTGSDSMIAGLPSRPLPDQENGAEDDFEQGSPEDEESDLIDEEDDDSNSSDDNSDRFEDWYEPDPAY